MFLNLDISHALIGSDLQLIQALIMDLHSADTTVCFGSIWLILGTLLGGRNDRMPLSSHHFDDKHRAIYSVFGVADLQTSVSVISNRRFQIRFDR